MSTETPVGLVRKASGWSIVWGILMVICGVAAIAMPLASSISLAVLLGWLIVFGGVWHLIFAFHSHGIGSILWKVLLAFVYGCAGIYMLLHPVLAVLSLTLVLAIFLFVEGVVEIVLYFNVRTAHNAIWILFDGIVTLILGLLIWIHWPSTAVWVIGTLVGISLIFSGFSRIMLSAAVRKLTAP
jgi:uncharacterized membrane protein HdeD (DUF308 family)